LGAFLAVAEKKVASAGGAQVADEDVCGTEASTKELSTISFAEVEEDVLGRGLVAGGHHVQPLDGIGLVASAKFVEPFGGFGELGLKLGGNFGADFIAAATNGGADGGEEVSRLGFELHLHLADGFDDDPLERASPAGMNSGDRALFWIDDENGDAVGGLHAQKEAGAFGDGGVALARFGGRGVEKMDDIGMDLFQGDKFEIGCVEGGLEAAAVFADTAGLGAEAVDEPGEL